MLYYKVNAEKHDYFTGYTTVIGELITEKERQKNFRYLPDHIFSKVQIPKNKTVFIFGARFEIE